MDGERGIRQRLKEDFAYYARHCLKIRTKIGSIEPLNLNTAQRYIHQVIEEQLARVGRVRALILKARQEGCSTYVEARFFWRVTHRLGVRAYILTHLDETSRALFEMTKRYLRHCPAPVKPHTKTSNIRELRFDGLDSAYGVGTAGGKGTGLGQTVQYFHGSEVAYWPNADTHMTGVLQAVSNAPGTEIILESTSAGPMGVFYEMWMAAVAGTNGYIPIFIPWFWQDEYREPVPDGFVRDEKEEDTARAYGLDDEQLMWRRSKVVECGGPAKFKQQYPATAEEAFAESYDKFFENWSAKTGAGDPWHVIPTSDLPKGLNWEIGLDWGFKDPCAIYLIGIWPDGRMTVCREKYQTQRRTRDLGLDMIRLITFHALAESEIDVGTLRGASDEELIEAIESGELRVDNIVVRAGHDVFNQRLNSKGEHDEPIANLWLDMGLNVVIAGRDPLNRANKTRDMLSDWGPDDGWPGGRPGLQVMECCDNLIRTLPLLKADSRQIEIVDTEMDDHGYDALGHVLTAQPDRPAKPEPEAEMRPRRMGKRQRIRKTRDPYDPSF